MAKRPNVIEYQSFRKYLCEMVTYLRQVPHDSLSLRNLSIRTGFRSHSSLKSIMDGKKNLPVHKIDPLAFAMGLSSSETDYFRNLVSLDQSLSGPEKARYARELIRSKGFRRQKTFKNAQYGYLSHWYYVAIRELVGCKDFQEDITWISRQFDPPLSVSQVQKALTELALLGLIGRNREGELRQASGRIRVADKISSSLLAELHRTLIDRGRDSIEKCSPDNREVSGVTVPVSEKGMHKIMDLIRRTREEIHRIAETETDPDRVYQANFQFFPLTSPEKNKNKGGGK